MGLIDTEEAAKRLVRVILSDIELYRRERPKAGETLEEQIEEGRKLFGTRVTPALLPLFSIVLADREAAKAKASSSSSSSLSSSLPQASPPPAAALSAVGVSVAGAADALASVAPLVPPVVAEKPEQDGLAFAPAASPAMGGAAPARDLSWSAPPLRVESRATAEEAAPVPPTFVDRSTPRVSFPVEAAIFTQAVAPARATVNDGADQPTPGPAMLARGVQPLPPAPAMVARAKAEPPTPAPAMLARAKAEPPTPAPAMLARGTAEQPAPGPALVSRAIDDQPTPGPVAIANGISDHPTPLSFPGGIRLTARSVPERSRASSSDGAGGRPPAPSPAPARAPATAPTPAFGRAPAPVSAPAALGVASVETSVPVLTSRISIVKVLALAATLAAIGVALYRFVP